jgi:antitoxin component YwqK of YwqJK toxin-antitoxin module
MRSLSTRHLIALTTPWLLSTGQVAAQAQATLLPPAHTYYVDQYGRETKVVKERWAEDTNGEKNGLYLKYDSRAEIIARYTYAHGVKEGAAMYVAEYGAANWHVPCKYTGSFRKGNKVGTWLLYLVVTGNQYSKQVDVKEEYDEHGILLRSTFYKNGQPSTVTSFDAQGVRSGPARIYAPGNSLAFAAGTYVANQLDGIWQNAGLGKNNELMYSKGGQVRYSKGAVVSVSYASGKTVTIQEIQRQQLVEAEKKAAVQLSSKLETQRFYYLSSADDATFLKTQFTTANGVVTGEQLLKMEYATSPEMREYFLKLSGRNQVDYLASPDIGELIKLNKSDPAKILQLLRKSYQLTQKSPLLYVAMYPAAREDVINPIMATGEPRLLGELLYYSLRGLGVEKGIDNMLVIKRVIPRLASYSADKKRDIEAWFNSTAQAGDPQYRDISKYPLRRWLYEEFKNDNPYAWMNSLTEDSYHQKLSGRIAKDAPNDEQLYPVN